MASFSPASSANSLFIKKPISRYECEISTTFREIDVMVIILKVVGWIPFVGGRFKCMQNDFILFSLRSSQMMQKIITSKNWLRSQVQFKTGLQVLLTRVRTKLLQQVETHFLMHLIHQQQMTSIQFGKNHFGVELRYFNRFKHQRTC